MSKIQSLVTSGWGMPHGWLSWWPKASQARERCFVLRQKGECQVRKYVQSYSGRNLSYSQRIRNQTLGARGRSGSTFPTQVLTWSSIYGTILSFMQNRNGWISRHLERRVGSSPIWFAIRTRSELQNSCLCSPFPSLTRWAQVGGPWTSACVDAANTNLAMKFHS